MRFDACAVPLRTVVTASLLSLKSHILLSTLHPPASSSYSFLSKPSTIKSFLPSPIWKLGGHSMSAQEIQQRNVCTNRGLDQSKKQRNKQTHTHTHTHWMLPVIQSGAATGVTHSRDVDENTKVRGQAKTPWVQDAVSVNHDHLSQNWFKEKARFGVYERVPLSACA